MSPMKQSFWQSPLTRSSVPKDKVTTPETLLGYLIGPFGALRVLLHKTLLVGFQVSVHFRAE